MKIILTIGIFYYIFFEKIDFTLILMTLRTTNLQKLRSERFDVRGELRNPFAGL